MNFCIELREELYKIGVNILRPTSDLVTTTDELKQFCIIGDFAEFNLKELALLIKSHSTKIVFIPLPSEKSVKFCRTEHLDDVYARYIEDFAPGTDKMIGRWDVLIY